MERLVLDTGIVIALERRQRMPADAIPDDADIAVAAVTASELLLGVELADASHRETREQLVETVLTEFVVLPFDLSVARHHADLLAHARRTGRPRGAHDLQIAATARASGRRLLTTDVGAFDDLPGVIATTITLS